MIQKFDKYSKINENDNTDYYNNFALGDGGLSNSVEYGWVSLIYGEDEIYFSIESGEDVFNVSVDSENDIETLKELGVKLYDEEGQTHQTNDLPFEDFIHDVW